ncbi:hypothetical protein D3C86_2111680 [compost metagenome]
MPVANDATPIREVEVAQFRKNDFEDLEIWASEMGVSTDELASQILRKAGRFLSRRGEPAAGDNVVQFGPRR